MLTLAELDPGLNFLDQLELVDEGPVILVNTFKVPVGQMEQAIGAWAEDAALMKIQPGFVSAQLHRGIGSSSILVNFATWRTASALRDAFMNPNFQATLKDYPDGTVASPHIVTRVAVSGICDA